jgi:hypothetical protein
MAQSSRERAKHAIHGPVIGSLQHRKFSAPARRARSAMNYEVTAVELVRALRGKRSRAELSLTQSPTIYAKQVRDLEVAPKPSWCDRPTLRLAGGSAWEWPAAARGDRAGRHDGAGGDYRVWSGSRSGGARISLGSRGRTPLVWQMLVATGT